MGSAFGKAIIDFDRGVNTWHVLQPPTGSGKTQGTCVYCSLAARLNEAGQRKLGILIVTRQIVEAENLVAQINRLAGRDCAIANEACNAVNYDDVPVDDLNAMLTEHPVTMIEVERMFLTEWQQADVVSA
jgi:hypothetical protein